MNERIRQLAVRAKEQTEEFNSVRNKLTAEEWEEIYNEKFAELIVRECAGIYDKIDNGNLHMGTDNYLEALQKHFGVEE